MSELYLIAHIVRGEPAFDIASQIEVNDEVIWIIPTSGHRAWPYWSALLEDIDDCYDLRLHGRGNIALDTMDGPPEPPSDWPDHYSTTATPGRGLITNLASLLGIGKREEVKRRV